MVKIIKLLHCQIAKLLRRINNITISERKRAEQLNNFSWGFTLIELLVVVGIIGILAAIVVPNFMAARERSRDGQRKTDLRSIQTALQIYHNDKGNFPNDTGGTDYRIMGCGTTGDQACVWGNTWQVVTQVYMKKLPKDPSSDRNYRYDRITNDSYNLKACLENRGDDKCSTTTETWCNTTLNGCLYLVEYE